MAKIPSAAAQQGQGSACVTDTLPGSCHPHQAGPGLGQVMKSREITLLSLILWHNLVGEILDKHYPALAALQDFWLGKGRRHKGGTKYQNPRDHVGAEMRGTGITEVKHSLERKTGGKISTVRILPS